MACFFFAKLCGHTVCLRAETPLNQEPPTNNSLTTFRAFILKNLLFNLVERFLFIGYQNLCFYKHYGIKNHKLIFTPYCVDNHRFQETARSLKGHKSTLRASLGIPSDAYVLLYSGKYIAKKRPLDLLKAVSIIHKSSIFTVFVGDGELRSEMEGFIQKNDLDKTVLLTGFINQKMISQYYAVADAFVMCSGIGETWGLSTNEAMNFSLPVILSDHVGCADDLVDIGKNGFSYRCGDISDLAEKIIALSNMSDIERLEMGNQSLNKVAKYSYYTVINGLKNI